MRGLLAKLGKHRMGKSCLYFRRLADLDAKILERLVAGSVAELRRLYPAGGVAAISQRHALRSNWLSL